MYRSGSLHAAKGHEFAAVFIVGLVDGVLPPQRVDENDLTQERAVLYVGMTRARDILCLSHSKPAPNRPSQMVSPLLKEVLPRCDSYVFRRRRTEADTAVSAPSRSP